MPTSVGRVGWRSSAGLQRASDPNPHVNFNPVHLVKSLFGDLEFQHLAAPPGKVYEGAVATYTILLIRPPYIAQLVKEGDLHQWRVTGNSQKCQFYESSGIVKKH